jgi:predicted dehydrogenase
MLPIGVIGAGTEWEGVWRPAFSQLSRLVVSTFYDPIAIRGERVAEAEDWQLAGHLRGLLDTPKLRGVVVLDAGWCGNWVVEEADRRHIPVLVSPREASMESLAPAFKGVSGETLIQPELRRRYTPATMRVKELTATRLGPVKSLRVELLAAIPPSISQWAEVIDWCRFVVQSAVTRADYQDKDSEFGVAFRKLDEGRPMTAKIVWKSTQKPPLFPADFAAELTCRDGMVIVTGNRRVRWKAGDEEGDEELADDRTSAAVQLDLFARRLSGGLVPVATLEDVAVAVNSARTAIG